MNAKKSKKRIKLVNDVVDIMRSHENLGENINRKSKTENAIQSDVFSKLNSKLPELLNKNYNIKNSKELVKDSFCFESKTTCRVASFPFFNMNHRPDATLTLSNLKIAFEIKKGESGPAIRSGIGQALVYSSRFDFVIYFFVDTSKARDIKNVKEGGIEKALIKSLWENYNIKFVIV